MNMPDPAPELQENPSALLETVFRRIAATRMAGVGILNAALEVEAVGFRRWNNEWVGVLITPWFMSLICLPSPASTWYGLSSGSKRDRDLPSGSYEFLTAHEEDLGPYLTSSLFSPMFDFETMAQAREVASAVLAEMFTPAPPAAPESTPAVPEGMAAKLEKPVSRRGFFGALLRSGDKD